MSKPTGVGSGNYEHKGKQLTNYQKSPVIGDNQYEMSLDETADAVEEVLKRKEIGNALKEAIRYRKQPIVKSEEEAEGRLEEYFNHCLEENIRPTVENMALCLGTTRKTLWEWENDMVVGPVSSDVIKKAKGVIAAFDANLVIAGRMNPVAYIFRAKNYYGMKDQQDLVLTPNTQTEIPAHQLIADAEDLPD